MKFESIQRLSVSQWVWMWSAYWRLVGVQIRIKLKQQQWLKSKITFTKDKTASKSSWNLQAQPLIEAMHESVRLASRFQICQAACLPRSIVLADMLTKKGLRAAVILGISKCGDALASHAWVEVNGVAVCEPESVAGDFYKVRF